MKRLALLLVVVALLVGVGLSLSSCDLEGNKPGEVTGGVVNAPATYKFPPVKVVLYDENGELAGQTYTDQRGTFFIRDVPPGKYTLEVLNPRTGATIYKTEVTVEPGGSHYVSVDYKDLKF